MPLESAARRSLQDLVIAGTCREQRAGSAEGKAREYLPLRQCSKGRTPRARRPYLSRVAVAIPQTILDSSSFYTALLPDNWRQREVFSCTEEGRGRGTKLEKLLGMRDTTSLSLRGHRKGSLKYRLDSNVLHEDVAPLRDCHLTIHIRVLRTYGEKPVTAVACRSRRRSTPSPDSRMPTLHNLRPCTLIHSGRHAACSRRRIEATRLHKPNRCILIHSGRHPTLPLSRHRECQCRNEMMERQRPSPATCSETSWLKRKKTPT